MTNYTFDKFLSKTYEDYCKREKYSNIYSNKCYYEGEDIAFFLSEEKCDFSWEKWVRLSSQDDLDSVMNTIPLIVESKMTCKDHLLMKEKVRKELKSLYSEWKTTDNVEYVCSDVYNTLLDEFLKNNEPDYYTLFMNVWRTKSTLVRDINIEPFGLELWVFQRIIEFRARKCQGNFYNA
jgi:hypothetical protein